jgi:hypothetical protein
MNEYNEQGERHGLWKKYWREDYWSDGNLKEKGNYLNWPMGTVLLKWPFKV